MELMLYCINKQYKYVETNTSVTKKRTAIKPSVKNIVIH